MSHETTDHLIDRRVLEAALPADRGAFDIEDPFQCYAFMWLQFECCTCWRTEMFADADYPEVGWIISASSRARRDGWGLAAWSADGILDGRLRCPECTQRVT